MNIELRQYVRRLMRLGYSRHAAVQLIRQRAVRDAMHKEATTP